MEPKRNKEYDLENLEFKDRNRVTHQIDEILESDGGGLVAMSRRSLRQQVSFVRRND